MCFCSAVLAAQQPGQRFPNRPRLFPRMNQDNNRPQPGAHPAPPNLDADGDGVVSEQEILAAVRGHLNSQREQNPQAYRKIMRRFDADKDGEISDAEAMEIHHETERRMRQGAANEQGRPMPGNEPHAPGNSQPGERRLSDNGLLKGIKIEGLNLSSDL